MKTAKEWQSMWRKGNWFVPSGEQIQAIQSDAYNAGLLRAAEICRESERLFLKPHNRIPSAIEAIEAESQKGLKCE